MEIGVLRKYGLDQEEGQRRASSGSTGQFGGEDVGVDDR
jgi:hypothetical protein